MFTIGVHHGPGGFDPLILLVFALAIDAYLGEMRWLFRWLPHPVKVIGGLTAWFDAKLNRESRSQPDRAIRGGLVVLVICVVVGAAGWGVAWLSQNVRYAWILELFLLVTLLAQRELYVRVRNVGRALRDQPLEAAREAVGHIVGRNPAKLDAHAIARAAIESCAENFNDGVVAPVFWYVLFGFPGLLIYKAVNTMDSMIGYRTPKYRAFGFAAARLDDLLSFVPARLAGLFIAIAALFVPTARPNRAIAVMLRDARKHRSLNAGWPEGAMAGALDLLLAGPREYQGEVVRDPWIGEGKARATPVDIRRALYVFWVACLIDWLAVAVLTVVRFS